MLDRSPNFSPRASEAFTPTVGGIRGMSFRKTNLAASIFTKTDHLVRCK